MFGTASQDGDLRSSREECIQLIVVFQLVSASAKPKAMHGHFSAAHKDGLRIVTGSYAENDLQLPKTVQEKLTCLALELDEAQKDVIQALAHTLQYRSAQDLGERLDIPLLCPEQGRLRPYGLLDVVRYHANGPEVVVAPHVDPGLLILSLPPGLALVCND